MAAFAPPTSYCIAIKASDFFLVRFPPRANLTEAPMGVALLCCPPVLLYISVSNTKMLMSYLLWCSAPALTNPKKTS